VCHDPAVATTVRAGVFPGDGTFDVREFPAPEPPEGGAVLAVDAVGLCGSDLAQLDGVKDVPGQQYPVVPGHEIVGTIAAITPEAAAAWRLAEGDRVCVDEIVRCGSCQGCRSGSFCWNMQLYGYTMSIDDGPGLWGGYGEQMALLPGTNLHKVPNDIPPEELTMFEPLASAVNWVQRVGVQLGDTVVVQGPGHQGLACVMAARAAGATKVIVTGTSADGLRLEAARALGADEIIDVEQENPVERVAALTEGQMADVVMDVAAVVTSTVPLAVDLATMNGRVLLAGLKLHRPVEGLVSDMIVLKSLTVVGGAGFTPPSMRTAVELLVSGRVDRSVLVGDVVTLDTLGEGLDLLARRIEGRDSVHVSLAMTPA
jgi:threonine dehydrogenase-like Zn-dependent dehydrogenase